MSELVRITVAFVLSILLGVTSLFALSGDNGMGVVRVGAWRSWRKPADPDSWPYVRLHFLLDERLPPSRFLKMIFIAENDDEDRTLTAECIYRLQGRLPPVRWWSLHIEAAEGKSPARTAHSLTSEDALVMPDGALTVMVDRAFQPGNWLATPKKGHFRIILVLYGVSPLLRERMNTLKLPRIIREDCS